jgi:hypothetical protein
LPRNEGQGDGPFGQVTHGRFHETGADHGQAAAAAVDGGPALLGLGLDLQLTVKVVVGAQGDGPLDDVEGAVGQVGLGGGPTGEEHAQAMVAGGVLHVGGHLHPAGPTAQGDRAFHHQGDALGGAHHGGKVEAGRHREGLADAQGAIKGPSLPG